jgi:hypothetical protein
LDWSAWVIFVFLIAAIGVGLYLVAYTRAGGFSNTHAPVFTTNVATESTPIQTITPTPEPVPTPTPTPAPSSGNNTITQEPVKYIDLSYGTVTFSNSETNGRKLFYATINGTVKCTKELPLPVSQASLTANITASLADKGTEVTLQPEWTIAVKPFPARQGETAGINEKVWLQFPEGAQPGKYDIKCNVVSIVASDNLSTWYNLTSYISPREKVIGQVAHTAEQPAQYYYYSGYVREYGTNNPIAGAVVRAFSPDVTSFTNLSDLSYVHATATTDSNGYYMTTAISTTGPFYISVTADGYEQKWYDNVTDNKKASQLTITAPDRIQKIDFNLEKAGSISGKVISDADLKGIDHVVVNALDYLTGGTIASAYTSADGIYQLVGLASGTYKVKASPSSSKLPYNDQYFNKVYDFNSAKAVTIIPGQDTPGINFTLPLK